MSYQLWLEAEFSLVVGSWRQTAKLGSLEGQNSDRASNKRKKIQNNFKSVDTMHM